MKNRVHVLQFFCILFISNILLVSCHHDVLKDTHISVKPKDGFSDTHVFENAVWTFPKVDDGIDKEIHFKGTFPDVEESYKLTVNVDFYDDIEVESVPFVITTTSPDGNSVQSTNVTMEFTDDETVTDLAEENGRVLKRATKLIYPSKEFREEGTYTFTVYSKYPKMSLHGIKSVTIAGQKTEK